MRHQGASYLQMPLDVMNQPWFVASGLDVAATLLVVFLIFVVLVAGLVRLCYKAACKRQKAKTL